LFLVLFIILFRFLVPCGIRLVNEAMSCRGQGEAEATEREAEAETIESEAEAENYEQPKSNKFNCAKSSPTKNKFVSSANIITFVRRDTLTRSLLYKRNRSGPRTDPCGTPQAIHY